MDEERRHHCIVDSHGGGRGGIGVDCPRTGHRRHPSSAAASPELIPGRAGLTSPRMRCWSEGLCPAVTVVRPRSGQAVTVVRPLSGQP